MIAIISGTNRTGSTTRKVAAELQRIYEAREVPVVMLDLLELPPQIFDPGAYSHKPESFRRFSDAVLQAAGLVVVCPEYNGGMPGALKYFIDMLEFPESFEQRPVCFVGLASGPWGALRPVEQLQGVFGFRNAYIYPKRVFLPGISRQLDDSGRFKDEETVARLERQADGFLDFVARLEESE